jgi:hypothetical protein
MMSYSDDPVRDADRYNSDMEDRPMRQYEGQIELVIKLDCFGKNSTEAEDDLDQRADELRDYIMCLKTVGDVEVAIDRIHVEEEME